MGERRQLHRLAAVWLLLLAAVVCHARPQDAAITKPEADNAITSGALAATSTAAPKVSLQEKEVARDVSNSGGALLGTRRWSPRRGSPALGPSIASVAGQLLEDTRTPPLVQQLRAQAELQGRPGGQGGAEGEGEAVPVLLEEHELADERRVQQILDRTRGGAGPAAGTTRPQPGISTWVLLSGSNSSPAPEEASSTAATTTTKATTTTTTTQVKNNKKGGGKPAAASTATSTSTTGTTAAAPPQKSAGGGGRKPAPGGGQTPRPPPSTAANNKFVQQFRPLLHRPASVAKPATAAAETSTARPQSTTTTTSRTTTTRSTTAAAPTTKKPPKTTTTTTTARTPDKGNRTAEPEGVQLLAALTRQPPPKAKPAPSTAPSPAAPTAAAFRRRPAANGTTTVAATTTTTTAAPQPTTTTAQPPAKATTSKVKTTTTTTTTTTPPPVTTIATRGPEETSEDATETAPEESTTKRQRRPAAPGGNKKRKKNKNKRRKRPTGQQQPAESKVTEVSPELQGPGNATRPAGNKQSRPLSTRIYNYLAREVMPSVGVGLIGLVVTAGLAGLMLYPFGGGVAARRTYEEEQRLRYPHQGGFLYYEGAGPDGKPEEAVLREVFEGMAPVDEPVSSYHQPQAGDDADGTYSYSPGSAVPGYGGHQYPGSYAAMASSTTPPPGGQAGPYYSGHADAASEYRRPQYHQRLEATPKHAATAASPVASSGSVAPEKFYGSEAVHVRTADVPKYSGVDGSQALSGEHQHQQEKAVGYSVVSAGDRVGAVELSYGGRVRHRQVGEASSAIAEHGPRSLDTVQRAQTTEATHIETRKRRDITEDEVVRPDSLLADNDIDVVWAKEKKWPPKKEVGSVKQPVKWAKVDSTPSQGLKPSASEGPTSTNSPVTTESTTLPGAGDRVSVDDMESQTTDRARVSEETTGEPPVTEAVTVTEESPTEAPLSSSVGPAVEEFPTNGTDSSPAPVQQNQGVSITDILRRIAHFKMRLGVSLLKSSAEAFSRYLGTVQERMEDTLAEAGRARYHTGPGDGLAGVAFWNAVRRAQRGLFDRQRRRDE